VEIVVDDVVAIKALAAAPVRTADIRNLEHAAALAWPGIEQRWLDGWLLRAARGCTHRGNSAVPLGVEADASVLPTIVDWYASRGLTPWLSVPDRLLRLPDGVSPHLETVVLVGDAATSASSVTLAARPDEAWLRLYQRDVPVAVLTAAVDGDVVFGTIPKAAVGRAAVTDAADGRRWVGLSAVRVVDEQRRRGHGRALCSALLAWGFRHGASRAYAQVLADNTAAIALYESMGFSVQHRSRYIDARSL
jgi:N-acetylglutamate synthase